MRLGASIGRGGCGRGEQGDGVNPEQCEWDATYCDCSDFWFDSWPSGIVLRTLGLDPSKGKDAKHGDYSAFVKLGIDRNQVMYVEADLQRRPTPQIVEDGVELVEQFRPDAFAIETNQFQELLVAEFQRVSQQRKVLLPIYALPNQVNKQVRIRP